MAARRTDKRRRRRGRFGFLYKALSFLLILAAIVAGCAVFFRVGEVAVTGQGKYTADEIIGAAGVEKGENLFLLNKTHAAKQILGSLPYVDEVSIRRRLPDTLLISVRECVPAAALQAGEDWWILDERGKLLGKCPGEPPGELAAVTGVTPILPAAGAKLSLGEASSGKLACLVALLSALKEHDMAQAVGAVDLSQDSSLTLAYNGRFTVRLLLSADFYERVPAMAAAAESLQPNETGEIDLTGTRGYFRPGPAPGEQ